MFNYSTLSDVMGTERKKNMFRGKISRLWTEGGRKDEVNQRIDWSEGGAFKHVDLLT